MTAVDIEENMVTNSADWQIGRIHSHFQQKKVTLKSGQTNQTIEVERAEYGLIKDDTFLA